MTDRPGDVPPEPSSPYGGQPPYGSPWQAPPGHRYGYGQSNGTATTAMVLGIISVACGALALGCCLTLPGVLTGPFAIFFGLKARREIDAAAPGTYDNRGQAVAGFVTGIIGTGIGVLLLLLLVGLVALVGLSDPFLYDDV